jgi:general stress protein 26
MPNQPTNPSDVEHRLWDEIERHGVGMLAIDQGRPRAWPMNAFAERDHRRIWFFSHKHSQIAQAALAGRPALFTFQQRDLQASLSGRIQVRHDRARMDRFWNAVVAAWHPGGKNDPDLTLLSLECDEAEVWISADGPIKFAWEIAKANATHKPPELGGHTHLQFH